MNPITPKTEFLEYFRVHYPRLKELAARVKEDEEKFLSPYFDENYDLLLKKTDEYWEGVSQEEKKEALTFIWLEEAKYIVV